MSTSHFFERANHMQFYGGQSFTNANNIINNYNSARTELEPGSSSSQRDDDQWLILRGGQRLRRIDMCDIITLREVSSKIHHVSVKLKTTNPFRNRMRGIVKIRKRIQSAEVAEFGDRRFSVVSLEPEDDGNVEKLWTVLEPLFETTLSQRRVWLTQLFGVGWSMTPTLIYHDEVIDGLTVIWRYWEAPIVWSYLFYRHWHSVLDVQDDGTLQKFSIPLSNQMRDWTFNLTTRSFQYDVITGALSDGDIEEDYFDRLPPLACDCNPLLDPNEIICALPNFLQLVSLFGGYRHIKASVRHHVELIFGTVVNLRKPGILAYFPCIPSPVWSCELSIGTPDITAKYSKSVPSLVDLTFVKYKDKCKMAVKFSLQLPPEERLQTAYLVQSFPFYNSYGVSNDLVFIDELGFELIGIFASDLSSCPPKYLHVPPLSPKWINNMPCLRWPPKDQLFYWSFDRSGRMEIAKELWEQFGIPQLSVQPYFGSGWYRQEYEAVQEYLDLNRYDLGGQQFANYHGYPILVKGKRLEFLIPDIHPHIRKQGNGPYTRADAQ
ncbi:hypothetical protein E1B28_010557 [Marasmius oreades]|uniref:Uncharacterized protein n=1 Tax=Marasmius oreades TaxID=181124 RepID=A0A9P7RYU2_9AGAR|nr:uncharacterized protein E1B28_010557 [Marasmius oreades]KAG7091528.1 hypothetical protein E1B28_010557 [Marasmius oreades]